MLQFANAKQFNEIFQEGVLLVDFFATWCGPCKMLAPVLEAVEEQKPDARIVKVDVDLFGDIAQSYFINSVPTMFFVKNGKIIKKHSGYLPANVIIKMLEELEGE